MNIHDPSYTEEAIGAVYYLVPNQRAVLNVIERMGPIDDHDLVGVYRSLARVNEVPFQTEQSIRSRRAELVAMGKVYAADHHKRWLTGRKVILWGRINPLVCACGTDMIMLNPTWAVCAHCEASLKGEPLAAQMGALTNTTQAISA